MKVKPFLKWAGGKFRLLDIILKTLPQGTRLVEPFVGSGAVFLNASYQSYLLCDCNTDLISLFQHIQLYGEEYIIYCKNFFVPENNTEDKFYKLRNRFNNSINSYERAALLLYLNRHAFNGLVRYNSKGKYNVPYGKYKKPYFPYDELIHCYKKTQVSDITFIAQDFQKTFAALNQNDVVYADPPYIPLSKTASFTAYAGNVFLENEQRQLSILAQQAWQKGTPVVISNHDVDFTRQLYSKAYIQHFDVQRFISCNGTDRSKSPELLAAYL